MKIKRGYLVDILFWFLVYSYIMSCFIVFNPLSYYYFKNETDFVFFDYDTTYLEQLQIDIKSTNGSVYPHGVIYDRNTSFIDFCFCLVEIIPVNETHTRINYYCYYSIFVQQINFTLVNPTDYSLSFEGKQHSELTFTINENIRNFHLDNFKIEKKEENKV